MKDVCRELLIIYERCLQIVSYDKLVYNQYQCQCYYIRYIDRIVRNRMGFIYWLLNLLIPLILLTYISITTFKQLNTISYSKWGLMIIITYLMSWISWMFDDYSSVLFIDLVIKLIIIFLPSIITIRIQQRISKWHIETYIDRFRQYLLYYISHLYIKLTQYLLQKMNELESKQFRSLIMEHFNTNIKGQNLQNKENKISSSKINSDEHTLKSSAKTSVNYQTVDNQEQIVNQNQFGRLQQKQKGLTSKQLVSKEFIDKQYQLQQYNDEDQEQYPRFSYSSKSNRQIKETASKKVNYQIHTQQTGSEYKSQTIDFRYNRSPVQENKFYKSQTKSIRSQLSSPTTPYQPLYNQSQPLYSQHQYSQYQPRKSQFHKQFESATYHQQIESQYPHMLISQARQVRERVLECRVEVILEIGSGSSARLEIYYLELYSNRDVRIVSLYEREFQSHRLHSLKSLPHGYFELVFEGGKIRSRRCKFREGEFEPFLKYLN